MSSLKRPLTDEIRCVGGPEHGTIRDGTKSRFQVLYWPANSPTFRTVWEYQEADPITPLTGFYYLKQSKWTGDLAYVWEYDVARYTEYSENESYESP